MKILGNIVRMIILVGIYSYLRLILLIYNMAVLSSGDTSLITTLTQIGLITLLFYFLP